MPSLRGPPCTSAQGAPTLHQQHLLSVSNPVPRLLDNGFCLPVGSRGTSNNVTDLNAALSQGPHLCATW